MCGGGGRAKEERKGKWRAGEKEGMGEVDEVETAIITIAKGSRTRRDTRNERWTHLGTVKYGVDLNGPGSSSSV